MRAGANSCAGAHERMRTDAHRAHKNARATALGLLAHMSGQLHFACALGELLATAVGSATAVDDRPDLLVPVPLHRSRLIERGYNQALEIATPLAAALGLPLAPQLCTRVRHTPGQTGLSASARRRNLRGAFAVRGTCAGCSARDR